MSDDAEDRREKKHRFRMELIMVIATVLSAIATIAAVCVGYFQYQAAHEALVAADRNQAFQDYSESLDALCVAPQHAFAVATAARVVNEVLKGVVHPTDDDDYSVEYYNSKSKPLAKEIEPLLADFDQKARRFKIWANDGSSSTFDQIHFIRTQVNKLHFLADPKVFTVSDARHEWFDTLNAVNVACTGLTDSLVNWYRTGQQIQLGRPVKPES